MQLVAAAVLAAVLYAGLTYGRTGQAVATTVAASVLVILAAVVGARWTWKSETAPGRRIDRLAGITTALATALVAIFAIGLFGVQRRALEYDSAQSFGSASARLTAEIERFEITTTPYAKVIVRLVNASAYPITDLRVFYRHWDSSSWLGLLGWYSLPETHPWTPHRPARIEEHGNLSGLVGSETAVDLPAALDRGVYFALRADWDTPGHGRSCRDFLIRIFRLDLGTSPMPRREQFAGFVRELPGTIEPPRMPPCRGSRGAEER
jgi:hypothetical protein